MTTEQIITPRYKVIAPWPGMAEWEIKVGRIITDGYLLNVGENYPHLFKRLEWWEERKPEDMPQYVKYTRLDNNELVVIKVYKWGEEDGCMYFWSEIGKGDVQGIDLPATEQDYQQYLTQQTSTNAK